ncbi:MAG: hypothetical protein CMJ64_04415 [Planctomycetaceae bacterium]|nr:hypothetical protein [Planctomycetaceae bacterium]
MVDSCEDCGADFFTKWAKEDAGYAAIVKKSQRQSIYSIQDKYVKQIGDLNKQIQALEQKRDAEIAGVLSAEQKQVLALIKKIREEEKAEDAETAAASAGASAGN